MSDRPLTVRVPLLSGGQTSQPASLAFPNQVAESLNFNSKADRGAARRAGTSFVTTVTGLAAGKTYGVHPIVRDELERYLVVYGDGVLKVMTDDGAFATVNTNADALAYIGSVPWTQLRLLTITDQTFIANTQVVPKTFDAGISYVVTATLEDYYVLTARIGVPDAYYQALEDTDDTVHQRGYYKYVVPAADNGWANWLSAPAPESHRTPRGRYDNTTYGTHFGFRVRFQKAALTGTGVSYDHTNGRITLNNSLIVNDWVRISGGSFTDGYYRVTAATGTTFDIDQASNTGVGATTGTANLTPPGSSGTCNVANVFTPLREVRVPMATYATMESIALELQESLQGGGGDFENALIGWEPGSGTTPGRFRIIAPYRGTNTGVTQILSPVTGSTYDLSNSSAKPFHFSSGQANAGTGTPSSLTMKVNDRWETAVAPSAGGAIFDTKTMPVVLKRQTTVPLVFSLELAPWESRLSGNNDSNPAPKFIENGSPIEDLLFWGNRFGLVAGEYVLFGQADDLLNLWKEDAANAVASDPIEVTPGTNEVANIAFVATWKDRLVAMSKGKRQYESNVPDVLEQGKLRFTSQTRRNSLPIRPRPMDHALYFMAEAQGDNSGAKHAALCEYVYDDRIVASRAPDVSAHAFQLLPSAIANIWAVPDLGSVIVVPVDGNSLYRYTTHWEGPQKQHSAWDTYTLDPSNRLAGACVLDNELWLLTEDPDNFIFERLLLTMGEGVANDGLTTYSPAGTPPSASLTATPTTGVAPLAVTFNSSGSTAGAGSITSRIYDFNDNGTYSDAGAEATAAGNATPAAYTYDTPGLYTARVLITNTAGLQDIATVTITVTDSSGGTGDGRDSFGGGGIGDPTDGLYTESGAGDITYDIVGEQ